MYSQHTHLFLQFQHTVSRYYFDLNFMRNNQDFKPNFGSYRNHNHKSNHSSATLISLKDHNKPLISRERERERENQRNLNDKSQKKKQLKQINIDYEPANNGRVKQFRQKPTHSQAYIKKADNDQTLHVNYNTTQDPVHGILISVNIQDLITPRHLQVAQPNIVNHNINNQGYDTKKEQASIKTDRTQKNCSQALARQQYTDLKRVAKTTSMINVKQEDFQFECKQELSYHKRTSPPPRQRTVSKNTVNQKNRQQIMVKQKTFIESAKLDPQKLIQQFASTIDQINNNSSIQSLQFLDNRQAFYRINPKYIEDCQPNFTWLMRAYVVQWMMEVAQQFALKRQTFHISTNILDRYLGKEKNLSKSSFQAVGAASMFIASKIEQEIFKSPQDFAITTGKLITAAKLLQTQRRIYQVLQFHLNPPTLCRWANRMMVQWDSYLQSSAGLNSFFIRFEKKFFKQNTEQSYINYRVLMQLIDCCTLDIETSQYNPKLIVCSFMYLYLLKEYKIYSAKDIANIFPDRSIYLFEEANYLNEVFNQFLFFTFGFVLQDLLPTIQYCAGYFLLPPNAEMPSFTKKNAHICENMQLEEYQSFQTYDKNMLKVVIKRRKREPI